MFLIGGRVFKFQQGTDFKMKLSFVFQQWFFFLFFFVFFKEYSLFWMFSK